MKLRQDFVSVRLIGSARLLSETFQPVVSNKEIMPRAINL
jgi:hypothetical protein